MTRHPAWLQLLRREYFSSGNLSLNNLVDKTGLEKEEIANIIEGQTIPLIDDLIALTHAITPAHATRANIIVGFKNAQADKDIDPENWASLLHRLYRKAGCPTIRALSEKSGVPKSTVANYLRHQVTPNLDTLEKILTALTDSEAEIHHVITAYRTRHHTTEQPPGRPTPPAISDTALNNLADAINNLADAIRNQGTH